MARKKASSPFGQSLRDWSGVVFGLAGAVLAILGYVRSGDAARQSEVNKQAIAQIEVMNLLNDAWDLMGGTPGTTLLYEFNGNASELEIASRKVKQALVMDPQNGRAHHLRGVVAEAFGNYAEAVEAYETALKLMPDSGTTRLNLGIALTKVNRQEEALKAFAEAVRYDETKVLALVNTGAVLWNSGQQEKARPLFAEARNILNTPQTGLVGRDVARIRAMLESQQLEPRAPVASGAQVTPDSKPTAIVGQVRPRPVGPPPPPPAMPYRVEVIRGAKRGVEVVR